MVLSVQTRLLRSIDEHLASYVKLWQLLDGQFSNSKGFPESQQFLETFASTLQQRGLQSQLLNPHLLQANLKRGGAHTLLFYHPQQLDSRARAAESAALLAALDVCKNVLGSVPINIQWLLDYDGTETDLKELGTVQSDACIWYHTAEIGLSNNSVPTLATATKGRLRVELEVQTATSSIDSMHGGIAPDALWQLVWATGSLKDAHEDILIDGFYDTLTPVQDDTMTYLHTLPDSAGQMAQQWGIQQLLMGLKGFQMHYAHLLLPTCIVNSITNDRTRTKTANELTETGLSTQAKAQIEFYLVPDQNPQDIFNKLQHHLQKQGFPDVQARMLSANSPFSTPLNNPFVQLAISATEKAYGQVPSVLPTTVGSYPVPATWMKDGTSIVFMARNGQPIENNTEDFARCIKQIVLLIEGMADGTGTTE